MKGYEHWANMLYPKMTFSDVTDRIEALAKKREFKVSFLASLPSLCNLIQMHYFTSLYYTQVSGFFK